MTGANARHHLGVLESEGLISQVGTRAGRGKGRPHKLFGIAEPILGNNLDQLARAMLDMWVENLEEEERARFCSQLAEKLFTNAFSEQPVTAARSPAERYSMGSHPAQRLNQVVSRLNELNYSARWEASALGPRIWLGHCPYLSLLPDHPELCQFDRFFLERLIGVPVNQTAKRSTDARGNVYCLFLVEK
jgi:predicted ArsR family transcriptional regulator